MTPEEILKNIVEQATATLNTSVIADSIIRERVDYICRCLSNRAGVRLLMACLLGKLDKPTIDPVSYTHLDVYKRQVRMPTNDVIPMAIISAVSTVLSILD